MLWVFKCMLEAGRGALGRERRAKRRLGKEDGWSACFQRVTRLLHFGQGEQRF